MTESIGDILPDDDDFKSRSFSLDHSKLHLSDMRPEEADLIRKVVALAHSELTTPTGTAPSLIGRVEPGVPISSAASEWLPVVESHLIEAERISVSSLEEAGPLKFPHLAWEALKLGLAKENQLNEKLNQCLNEIEKSQDIISLLLQLSGELSSLKDDDTELSPKAMAILEQLKNKGIDLNKEGQTAEELRRKVNSNESGLRSQMQIQFTTKVQRYMQQIESLMQILQNIIRNDSKLKEKTNQLTK